MLIRLRWRKSKSVGNHSSRIFQTDIYNRINDIGLISANSEANQPIKFLRNSAELGLETEYAFIVKSHCLGWVMLAPAKIIEVKG